MASLEVNTRIRQISTEMARQEGQTAQNKYCPEAKPKEAFIHVTEAKRQCDG